MNISPNAKATFRDGTTGHVIRVIYDPRTADVTHVVVQVGHLGAPRLVPVQAIDHSDIRGLHLAMTAPEVEACDSFRQVEYVPYDEAADPLALNPLAGDPFELGWPYLRPDQPVAVEEDRVPPDEIAFRRGASVDSSDGYVGTVGAFVVEQGSGHATHLVLHHGHLWGKRTISIPLSATEQMHEDYVLLSLTKEQVESLPDVPTS
ncbi:PRC-barrel domain-containing protein [Rubrivirga sp. S365]|uniref:PRC-barrel domain-containing protein n=1 Tax=Rubrivirga sp. S365 TaxID=3076080 RepID=UPI0028C6496A|nr:PRC-barrel domain-containing protein [Rubrivirga sp. S365]MDT7858343.1 PRC-barrel domain-containing protein [Rubrivirga sp. S365]